MHRIEYNTNSLFIIILFHLAITKFVEISFMTIQEDKGLINKQQKYKYTRAVLSKLLYEDIMLAQSILAVELRFILNRTLKRLVSPPAIR